MPGTGFYTWGMSGIAAVVMAIGVQLQGGEQPVVAPWGTPIAPPQAKGAWADGVDKVTLSWARTATKGFACMLDVTMKPGWHTYWQNPGDSGNAPAVKWDLPPGWAASPIRFVRPDVKLLDGAPFYGYEERAQYIVEIDQLRMDTGASAATNTPGTPPSSPTPPDQSATAPSGWKCTWTLLVCKERCVQGTFDFSGAFPPEAPLAKLDVTTATFNGRALPQHAEQAKVTTSWDGTTLIIKGPAQGAASARFIPASVVGMSLADPAAEQGVAKGSVKDGTFEIRAPLTLEATGPGGTYPTVEGLVLLGETASDPSIAIKTAAPKAPAAQTKP